MLLRKYFIGILILGCSMQTMAQTTNSQQDTHHFAFYGGFGPNLYFNNLVIGKNYVNTFNYSFTGRFMWEPGHVLSIGVESGYYRMYTLTTPQPNQVKIANSAIPLQIVLSMKFWENYYFNFSMGQSILKNNVTAPTEGDFNASALSVADFSGTFGYRHMLSRRFSIAAEAKYYYSSGFTDKNIALLFVGGYRF